MCETGSVSRLLTVRTGGSLIIPCYYDKAYAEYKKYWCFDATASYSSYQSFFTLTMRNLQHEDTGAYWCAVEVGGIFVKDALEQLQIKVQSGMRPVSHSNQILL
uniref:Ig-like domain-containing protein n=1 Tax=Cyprinus carpio TaxID=7962 RepID=A0A8C2HXG2_CYPCA